MNLDINKKYCKFCKCYKNLQDFLKSKKIQSGFTNMCKKCESRRKKAYRETASGKIAKLQAQKKYEKSTKGKRAKRKYQASDKGKMLEKLSRIRLKQRVDTRRKTRWLIQSGKIKKPKECSACGNTVVLEAHHTDYNDPSAIQFLCHTCHSNLHKK